MAAQSAQKRLPPATEIPDRLYFRIGDVAKICGVEPYVLRFWETQFPALKPNKGGTGQRLYRRREVELAVRIKQLVHEEGYTLAGARQALELAPRPRISPAVKAAAGKAPCQDGSATSNAGSQTGSGLAPGLAPGLASGLASSLSQNQDTPQGRLALSEEQAQLRLEAATAAIGRARAELRELARQLAVQEPTINRRRPRLATFRAPADPLFPL